MMLISYHEYVSEIKCVLNSVKVVGFVAELVRVSAMMP